MGLNPFPTVYGTRYEDSEGSGDDHQGHLFIPHTARKVMAASRCFLCLLASAHALHLPLNGAGRALRMPDALQMPAIEIAPDLLAEAEAAVKDTACHATQQNPAAGATEEPALSGSARFRGVCKSWHHRRGFGFITIIYDSAAAAAEAAIFTQLRDVFVHATELQRSACEYGYQQYRSLSDGEQVEFRIARDERSGRLKAVDVSGVDGAPLQLDAQSDFDDIFDELFSI